MEHDEVLAIDPANLTGWATGTASGTWDLLRRCHKSRLCALRNHIVEVLDANPQINFIGYEDAGFGAGPGQLHTMAMHNELRGVIKLCAEERGIVHKGFGISTIKLYATGDGHAKKPKMISACKRLLGRIPRDDNEADAIWILELSLRPDCWAAEKVPKRRKKSQRKTAQQGLF